MPADDVSLFRAVFTGTSDAVVALDRNHTITRVNPRFEAMVGSSSADLVGRSLEDLLAGPRSRPSAFGSGSEAPFLLSLKTSSGSIVDAEAVTALVDREGVPSGFLMILRDATARLRNQRLQTVLLDLATVDENAMADSLTSALLVAGELAGAAGVRLTDQAGTVLAEVGPPGHGPSFPCAVAGEVVATLSVTGVAESPPLPGLELLAHALGQRILSDRVSRQLMETQRELESRNADLERSYNDLARFSAALSHDLREPLRKISVLGRLMGDEHGATLTPEAEDLLVRIIGATDWMANLLEESLYYSRPSRRLDGEVPLDDVVGAAVETLEEVIADAGGQVSVDPLPTVLGNSSALTRLFLNLVANALVHRDDSALRVRIHSDREGDVCRIYVDDHGPGVDPQYSDTIFEVFTRAASDGTPGTGLGLAIARKIATDHGGDITHDPSYTEGARFVVSLPAA